MKGGRWPEIVGVTAVVDDERVVVVGSKGPHYLYLRGGMVLGALPRRRLRPEPGGANAAILAQALAAQVNDKSSVRRERGTFAPQLVQRGADPPTLYLYEAGYFGTLFPRWKWSLPGHRISSGTPAALWSAIVAEASSRELTALPDERRPATVAAEFPDAGPSPTPLYAVGFPEPASKFADVRCPRLRGGPPRAPLPRPDVYREARRGTRGGRRARVSDLRLQVNGRERGGRGDLQGGRRRLGPGEAAEDADVARPSAQKDQLKHDPLARAEALDGGVERVDAERRTFPGQRVEGGERAPLDTARHARRS